MLHWRPDREGSSAVSDVPVGWIPVGWNGGCSEEAAYLHSMKTKQINMFFVILASVILCLLPDRLNVVSFFSTIDI